MRPRVVRVEGIGIAILLILICSISCSKVDIENGLSDETRENNFQINSSFNKTYNDEGTEKWWHPQPGLTWQIQFDGNIHMVADVDVVDLDMDIEKEIVDQFHDRGIRVICYISAGSYEDWRSDAEDFPEEILGKNYQGWPGEKWLDIRRIDSLAPIMESRMDICVEKGFDAIEFDNIEIHDNNSGFPITYDDQLMYAFWLAEQAHIRGLAVGQKNAADQVAELVHIYDFAIIEDAFYYDWAEDLSPYINEGKAVFAIEYTDIAGDFDTCCELSKSLGFSTILKHRDLDAWYQTCP